MKDFYSRTLHDEEKAWKLPVINVEGEKEKRSSDRGQLAYSFHWKPLWLQSGNGCKVLPDGLPPQGYGDKHITLYDIRAELSCRYKDLRTAYRSPNTEEIFNMLTKETPETFYIGKF